MKIYCVSHPFGNYFCSSEAAAGKHRKYLNSEKGVPRAEITTTEVEVSPTRSGIIELLNELEEKKK